MATVGVKCLSTYIIVDARISSFTQQKLDSIDIAMLRGPHDRSPSAVVLDQRHTPTDTSRHKQ